VFKRNKNMKNYSSSKKPLEFAFVGMQNIFSHRAFVVPAAVIAPN
jgi:hypothetical protein